MPFLLWLKQLTSNGKIFWTHSPRFHGLGAIYGSYVNRNHYAGLMEMLVPIPLVVAFGHMLKGWKTSIGRFLRRADGHHDLSFRLAGRNDCVCPRGSAVSSTDFQNQAESSRSAGIYGSGRC